MMTWQETYTSKTHPKEKKRFYKKKNTPGRWKKKKQKFQLTELSKNPQTMLKIVEENIEKTLEVMSDESIFTNGTKILQKTIFPPELEKDSAALVIGDYTVQTSIDPEAKKFLNENLEFFTIMALYDAITTQFHLEINPLTWKISEEKHDAIRVENEKLSRAGLQDGVNFALLSTNKEVIKKMVFAVLKNLYHANKGESQKGIIGRSWDKLRGKAASPMAAFIEYIENNDLIKKLNKFTDDKDKAIAYYVCLTALKLTDESSIFNEILGSKLFKKMVGAMCYQDLDPRKAENSEGSEMIIINLYDKKNSMNLYKTLFTISDAKFPKLREIKGAEYALDSTMAIRLLTIGAGGLAIAGTTAAIIGYRGYKNPANKEIGFFNKFIAQAKKDSTSTKDWAGKTFNNVRNYFKPTDSLQGTINYIIKKDSNLTKEEKVDLLEKMKNSEANASEEKQKALNGAIESVKSQGSMKNWWYNRTKADENNEEPSIIEEKQDFSKSEKKGLVKDDEYWNETIGTAI